MKQLNEMIGDIQNKNNYIGPISIKDYMKSQIDKTYFNGIDLWRYIHPTMLEEINYRFDLLNENEDFNVLIGNFNSTILDYDLIYAAATSSHGTRGIGRSNFYTHFNCSDKIVHDKIVPNWIFSRWGTNDRSVVNWTFFYRNENILNDFLNKVNFFIPV